MGDARGLRLLAGGERRPDAPVGWAGADTAYPREYAFRRHPRHPGHIARQWRRSCRRPRGRRQRLSREAGRGTWQIVGAGAATDAGAPMIRCLVVDDSSSARLALRAILAKAP